MNRFLQVVALATFLASMSEDASSADTAVPLLPILQKHIDQLCADGKFSDDDATNAATLVLKFFMGPMPRGLKVASRVMQPDAEHVEVCIGYNNDLDSSWLLVRFRHHEHKSASWESVTSVPGE